MARVALTKKTRFEVFKRDSFTCQYCGQSSPDVVLNVDHMQPVAQGGTNDLLNLITSCFECNAGKSDRKIDDNSVVRKQITQLKELNARREQIEMIAAWRAGLMEIHEDSLRVVNDIIGERFNKQLSESGKVDFRKSIKKYGLEAVLEALDKSLDTYIRDPKDSDQINKALSYTHRIAYWTEEQRKDPLIGQLSHLCGIAGKRWYRSNRHTLFSTLKRFHQDKGIPVPDLKDMIIDSTGIMAFEDNVARYLRDNHVS